MRHMSFSKTIPQMKAKTKIVTRRDGWKFLKPGDRILAVEKCMGLKKGEKHIPLGVIEVTGVSRAQASWLCHQCGEVRKEGFPDMSPEAFLRDILGGDRDRVVTRIQFKHIEEEAA